MRDSGNLESIRDKEDFRGRGDAKMNVPLKVTKIIKKLQDNGYEAFTVGGCVRDSILKRVPKDWDITTSATPEQVKALFSRTIDTGIAHGTVTVMIEHEGFEVTTYRIDGEYEDSRHPKDVTFTTNLELDLERRDFTINAMAYNETTGLVDVFGGMQDIQHKMIRCVREASLRFEEDALRILRAVRFAGQLGFTIEDKTRQAATQLAGNLAHISAERVRVELTKLFISSGAGLIRDAYEMGITAVVLPELDAMMEVEQQNPHHIYTVGEHCIRSMENMNLFFENDAVKGEEIKNALGDEIYREQCAFCESLDEKTHIILAFTMLFHDMAKPACKKVDEDGIAHFYGHPVKSSDMVQELLKRLKFDNDTIHAVSQLIYWHDYRFVCNKRSVRRATSKIGKEYMELLFLVERADILAQSSKEQTEKLAAVAGAQRIYREIIQEGECLSLRDLAVSGKDLIEAGMEPGPAIGEVLKQMLEHVLSYPEDNQKEVLLQYKETLSTKKS